MVVGDTKHCDHFLKNINTTRDIQAGSTEYSFSDNISLEIFYLISMKKSEVFFFALKQPIACFLCMIGSSLSSSVSSYNAAEQINFSDPQFFKFIIWE